MVGKGVLLSLIPLSLAAQDLAVRASVDSARYRIGDWIHVRVDAEFPGGARIFPPGKGDTLGVFEVLEVDSGEPSSDGQGNRQSFIVRLTTFEPGERLIPPLEFRGIGENAEYRVETQPIPVSITSVEIEGEGELKDIKPPLAAPWAFEDVLPWLVLAAILGALAAAYALIRKRRRKGIRELVEMVPSVPPHEAALAALHALREKRLWQQGRVKEYYSEVTAILRRFFEGRFGIIAMELTSDEILEQLKPFPETSPIRKQLSSFFLTADLVKFAKYEPTIAENDEELHMAFSLVRALIPRKPASSNEVAVTSNVR